MNPVRRHGKFMKNRAEKAGGYVKKKRKIVVGILAALLCMTTGAYGYFSDRLEVKKSYHDGRHPDKYDRVCTKRKRRSEIS